VPDVTATGFTPPAPRQSLDRAALDMRVVSAFVAAVASRPWLWPIALTQTLRMARRGWWHRWPPLPLPDPSLWHFRVETGYGGEGETAPTPQDVRSFLRWCRQARDWRRG
jgi:hypothetical protein